MIFLIGCDLCTYWLIILNYVPKKKQKTVAASSSSEMFNKKRFVSLATFDRYGNSVVKKVPIQERGIQLAWYKVLNLIKRRKWEIFVTYPEPSVVVVVREFYSNANEHRNF